MSDGRVVVLIKSTEVLLPIINIIHFFLPPDVDRSADGGREASPAVRREDSAQHGQEPGRGSARGGRQQDVQAMGQLLHAG